jgi:hypothetical protein
MGPRVERFIWVQHTKTGGNIFASFARSIIEQTPALVTNFTKKKKMAFGLKPLL